MQIQVITLLEYYPWTGAAQLPVGVVVREPRTGQWLGEVMPSVSGESVWKGMLPRIGHPLTDERLSQWQTQANGVTWDVRVEEMEVDDSNLKAVMETLVDDLMRSWIVMQNEIPQEGGVE